MKKTDKERYLGDLFSADAKLDEHIKDRYNRGVGIVNQILGMLSEVTFGPYYYQTALLFRQSFLINSILCNFEVLYGLKKIHIDKIESIDKYLLSRIFNSPVTTPIESYYLELNIKPLRFVITGKTINVLLEFDSKR